MRSSTKNLLLGAAALALLAPAAIAQTAPALAKPEWGAKATPLPRVERGFTRILNAKNLDGWMQCGPGRLERLDDGSIISRGGMGMLWYAKEQYKDFILRLDFKCQNETSNSGVFVRFPDPGDDPWIAVNQGYEVQIDDKQDALHKTGGIYTFGPSTFAPSKPYGEWNSYEIKVVGQHYSIKINGKSTCEFDGNRSTQGYVGVQNHSDRDQVAFRNIRVKKLSAEKKGS
ncbi:MAG TPA: DUF1080 domain-containing protein [Armatimonadota bacterium]